MAVLSASVVDADFLVRMNRLTQLLAEQNRMDDIIKAASDKEYQQKLFEEFRL